MSAADHFGSCEWTSKAHTKKSQHHSWGFFNRMTVHREKFPVNETNRRTELQFYWYFDSTCFGQPFCPSSGVLSCTWALVHFMQLWWPFGNRSRMELQFHTNKSGIQCVCWFHSLGIIQGSLKLIYFDRIHHMSCVISVCCLNVHCLAQNYAREIIQLRLHLHFSCCRFLLSCERFCT